MPGKYALAALALGTLVFGLSISGCNRDQRTASRSGRVRTRERGVKPAEVLAVSVYRPSAAVSRPYRLPAPAAPAPAFASAVQPEAIPARPAPRAPVYAAAPAQYAVQPVAYVGPIYSEPSAAAFRPLPLIQPTPDLAIAMADLSAMAPAALAPVPPVASIPRVFPRAPIPELSPDFQRSAQAAIQPAGIGIRSRRAGSDRMEIQRALAPLAEQPLQPSPTPRVAALGNQRRDWLAGSAMVMGANF
jgi:hypothetical protein